MNDLPDQKKESRLFTQNAFPDFASDKKLTFASPASPVA
jgi:hypothetical protein